MSAESVHCLDAQADPEYTSPKTGIIAVKLPYASSASRSCEKVAYRRHHLARRSVRPFTDKQIELVKTFADQAVIAIENVRLFEAVQQRTRRASESLKQQTATSEVLQVYQQLPGDLEPVLQAMLANAARICEAKFGKIYAGMATASTSLASHNMPQASRISRRHRIRSSRRTLVA